LAEHWADVFHGEFAGEVVNGYGVNCNNHNVMSVAVRHIMAIVGLVGRDAVLPIERASYERHQQMADDPEIVKLWGCRQLVPRLEEQI
jgi:hypothetical protein